MNSSKENVLILFNGPHLAYSPSTIQFYDELSKLYNVKIIAQAASNYNGQELKNRDVVYHRYYKVKGRLFFFALFKIFSLFSKEAKYFKKNNLNYKDYFFHFLFVKKQIRKQQYKRVISVDIKNLFFCSLLNVKTDFISLELCLNQELLPVINYDLVNCVIIQSKERYDYLFHDKVFKIFYIQNAPNYEDIEIKKGRKGLIYAGGAYDVLGFYHCLNYIKQYEDETMVVQGALLNEDRKRLNEEYGDLLNSGRLTMNNVYLENDEVVKYISQYEIGFCFYNFDSPFIKDNYFNYASAPSGKMFKYMAAGVPVVASNIIGFKFVNEYQCGILIDDLRPEVIREAIEKIRSNYDFYVANTIKVAKHYSFDKAIEPYLEFIA